MSTHTPEFAALVAAIESCIESDKDNAYVLAMRDDWNRLGVLDEAYRRWRGSAPNAARLVIHAYVSCLERVAEAARALDKGMFTTRALSAECELGDAIRALDATARGEAPAPAEEWTVQRQVKATEAQYQHVMRLREKERSYAGGDRPPSPPAALLVELLAEDGRLWRMRERVAGVEDYAIAEARWVGEE